MSGTTTTRDGQRLCLIVGAGFAGIGTAVRLLQQGITDFVVLERSGDIGGTWRDNTYPGASCDVPSILYSYSFFRNPDWSATFSGSAEIWDYMRRIVDRYGLRQFIRFGQNVTETRFDELTGTWHTTTESGDAFVSRAVVAAQGPLANASLPDIRGIDTYAGHKMHSADWDHDFDMRGKRVAVIGTGASAVQIIPELVKQAERVAVYQRTPGWVLPRVNAHTPRVVRTLFRRHPTLQSAMRQAMFWSGEVSAVGMVWDTPVTSLIARLSLQHLHRQVKDPWMRRQLTPDFRPGCKRILVSSDYYPALQADHCKLITWPIATISQGGIKTCDGVERLFDCIVFATGFDVSKNGTPFRITGMGGRELNDEWRNGVYAYRSVIVSGYPNLFLTFGPNSGPGHHSALVYMEAQIDYAVQAITAILEQNLTYLDVRKDMQDAYNGDLQRRLTKTTWNSGCKSWYLTEDGFNGTMFPGFASQYVRQLKELRLEDYDVLATCPAGDNVTVDTA